MYTDVSAAAASKAKLPTSREARYEHIYIYMCVYIYVYMYIYTYMDVYR